MLGSGSTPFRSRVETGAGWNMYDQTVGAGDFDGNGFGDVIARDVKGGLWLYPGIGGGRLGGRRQIGTGWQIYNQVIGYVDENGDGALDLEARAFDGSLYRYLGDGHGGYGARVRIGDNDRATNQYANQGGLPTWGKNNLVGHLSSGHYAYYYADNDGTLTRYQADPWANVPEMQSAKRVTNPVSLQDEGYLGYVYQDGYDNLIPPSGGGIVNASSYSLFFAPGDLTGDGRTDLITRTTAGALYAFPGNGRGGFGARRYVGGGWNIYNCVLGAGDFTGDGRTDVAATTKSGALYLYRGLGNGAFGSRVYIGGGWQGYAKLAAPGDLNGDGKADLVGVDSAGRLWAYYGTGSPGFTGRRQIGTGGWSGFSSLS